MKCAHCGFVLLLAYKRCSRCGAAMTESLTPSLVVRDAGSEQPSPFAEQEDPASSRARDLHAAAELPQQEWEAPASPPLWKAQVAVSAPQEPSSLSQHFLHSPSSNTRKQHLSPKIKAGAAGNSRISSLSQEPFPRPVRSSRQKVQGRATHFGYTVAALCISTSGLILLFVYFMARNLPPISPAGVKAPPTSTSSTTIATPLVSPTLSPQPAIDHVQLASQVDPMQAQAVRITTTFKVNQRMYVTFDIHAGGHSGTVCLLWYLNTKQFSYYPLLVPGGRTLLPA